MSNDTQPEIRFPGFTEDWEQRRLSDVASIVGGGTPSTSNPEYWDGDIDWYAPAEIGDQIYVSKSLKTITELGQQKSSAKILPIGTVLFTSRAGIGNTAILAKEGTTNQGFQSIVPHKNKLDSYFIFSRTHELKRYGEVTGAGSTFAEVSGKQMAKMPILIPCINEQRKIGAFFEQLDTTITLHQRKLDLLKETKKGFLQKMFPKNGAKVPEIRFPGFTEDWEQRKLGEVSPLRGGFAFKSNKFVKEGIPIVRISNILSNGSVGGEFVYYTAQEKDENYLLPDKSALLAMSGATTGKVSILNNPNNNKVYQNQRVGYFTKTKNVDYSFISTLVRSKIFLDQLNSVLVAGAQPNISSKDINVFELTIPKNIEEQKKIGNFFKQLDDTIALHQRKLDLLKETKKGFLQKMFV
ncbi:TPA: restriction endonuclease subunit S [Enterococcus faecium]